MVSEYPGWFEIRFFRRVRKESSDPPGTPVLPLHLRMRDVTSPAERAVLAAIFEHQSMPYVVVDEEGSELIPSPYCVPQQKKFEGELCKFG